MAKAGAFRFAGIGKHFRAWFCIAPFILVATLLPMHAADLCVGAAEVFKNPSDAARAVKPGDTVTIDPGTYRDCAVAVSLAVVGSLTTIVPAFFTYRYVEKPGRKWFGGRNAYAKTPR